MLILVTLRLFGNNSRISIDLIFSSARNSGTLFPLTIRKEGGAIKISSSYGSPYRARKKWFRVNHPKNLLFKTGLLMTTDSRFCVTELSVLLWVALSWPVEILAASAYDSSLAERVAACQQIDGNEYQSGLLLNPEGYRTYYTRSVCFQRLAIEYRDANLCKEVRRRYALFSSGWGYSARNCRLLVDQKLTEDRDEVRGLRQNYLATPMSMSQLTVEPNGNGRDFDFIPRFDDGFPYGYGLVFRLIDDNGEPHVVLEHGGYLGGRDTNLRLFLTRTDLLARYPALEFNRPYSLEVSVTLDVGLRKLDGWLRTDVLEQEFPYRERTNILSTSVAFRAP